MDSLEERMKGLEDKRRIDSDIPIIARLDGKNFHNWTRHLDKPFDAGLSEAFIDTTRYLMGKTNALLGYTQSDEITLLWYPISPAEPPFGGKLQKLVSILASYCTAGFGYNSRAYEINSNEEAIFDCRVFPLLDLSEAANVFLWRRQDAEKNSVSSAASAHFAPKKLMGIKHDDRLKMLLDIGIDWDMEYDDANKYGTFIQRHTVVRPYSYGEIQFLPEKHAARTNPDLQVERQELQIINPTPSGYLEIFDLLKGW